MKLYEIDYKFLDEIDEDGNRCGLVVVYKTDTPDGDTLQHALDCASEDGDYGGVCQLLGREFNIGEDDVAFYYDTNGLGDSTTSPNTKLAVELQNEYGIIIERIDRIPL